LKISLNWLKEFVDIPFSVDVMAEKLTLLGFPVEGITQTGVKTKKVIACLIRSV